mgnify:FL=1
MFSEKAISFDQVETIFDPTIDQIGVACSCHLDFGKFCVFELGKSVKKIPQWFEDGTPKPKEILTEFSFEYEACQAKQISWSWFDKAKSDGEGGFCSEIDRQNEDVYSIPQTI